MRRFYIILLFLICCALRLFAQIIENPVFDRTDVYKFRVIKVESKDDTTFVYCSYSAEEHSWANISDKTYIEDVRNGKRYPIVKVSGIPFGPEKRHFTDAEEIDVILYFPQVSADKINIIENEENDAFNIYGIDLSRSYYNSYTADDIRRFFESYQKYEEGKNWHSALESTKKQLEASDYIEGVRSFASACSIYNMIMVYLNLEDYDKAIEWGKKAIDILCDLPQDSIYLDFLARTYGNVGTAYRLLKQIDKASEYEELSLTTRRLGDGIGTLNYEEYLTHLSAQYYREGNYPKALLYGREVVDIYKRKYEINNYKYGCVYLETLCNLCEFYKEMWQPKEAIKCGKIALNLFNEGVCDDEKGLRYWIYNNFAGALLSQNQLSDNKRGEKRKNRCKSGDWDGNCGMMRTVDCNLSTV